MGKLIIFLSRRCATINYTQHVKQHLQMRLLNHEFEDEINDPFIRWPTRFPVLAPCDFLLWGSLKSLFYLTPVNVMQGLHIAGEKIKILHFNVKQNNLIIFAK